MRETVAAPLRLFIGLFPGAAVQSAIFEHCRAWHWPTGRQITRRERLHMTLLFLGDCSAAESASLQLALAEVPMQPLDLVLTTAQVWRNGCAVLLAEEDAGLRTLQQNLEKVARGLGRATEQRWTPHLTVARHALEAVPPQAPPRIFWPVREFVLVWSRMSPVSSYEPLARYPA